MSPSAAVIASVRLSAPAGGVGRGEPGEDGEDVGHADRDSRPTPGPFAGQPKPQERFLPTAA